MPRNLNRILDNPVEMRKIELSTLFASQNVITDLEWQAGKRKLRTTIRGASAKQITPMVTCVLGESSDTKAAIKGNHHTVNIEPISALKTELTEVVCPTSLRACNSRGNKNLKVHKKIDAVRVQKLAEKLFPLQYLNNKVSRLRDWIQGFIFLDNNYLQDYLNRLRFLEIIKLNLFKDERNRCYAYMSA